jgi:O-antigen/teichoic acid export membrane protein
MSLKLNIAANFAGNFWTAIMSIIFVPVYIRFMGIEAYGLVGMFVTLLALFALLDMGLSNTLNREMARLSVRKDGAEEMIDFLRTLEIPYWIMAGLISLTVIVVSPLIAYHWVQVKSLPPATVRSAITIMGIAIAFQWPLNLYSGGLMGLQRQVSLNSINIFVATCRGLGAVFVLWFVSPTVMAFFLWQIVISAGQTGLVALSLWRHLPKIGRRPSFRIDLLKKVWRFAVGVSGITMLGTILTQLDKVILSRMLTLDMFGYYTLAGVVGISLYRLVNPVYTATYPQMTNLVSLKKWEALTELYHKSAQLVSVLILPAAVVIALFSKEILLLWTRDTVTAENTYLVASILVVGWALSGVMFVPYALQLANGWTRLSFFMNLGSVVVLAPLTVILARFYGAKGAAAVWVIVNSGSFLIGIPLMHRRLLPFEKWRWYGQDVGLPLAAVLVVVIFFRFLFQIPLGAPYRLCYLAAVSCAALLAAAFAASTIRHRVRPLLGSLAYGVTRKRVHDS